MSRGGRGYLVAEKGISICVVFRGGLRYNQNMRIASINTKDGGIQMFQFFMQFLKHPKTIGAKRKGVSGKDDGAGELCACKVYR